MNRSLTNVIRFLMDECLPPFIRDNKYFMYPFYYIAYRGKNLNTVMNLKRSIHTMNENDYIKFYDNLDTISRNRLTDLSEPCIKYMITKLDPMASTILDVGCGKGYFLSKILSKTELKATGCDIVSKDKNPKYTFVEGHVEKLPFEDNQFDIITCSHTLEHIVDLNTAIAELKRVARKQIIVVVPCQRYYYYTLDEHINFFPIKEDLSSIINLPEWTCEKIWGDWVYIGKIS